MKKDTLSAEEQAIFLQTLEQRFHSHERRHPSIEWNEVAKKFKAHPEKIAAIYQMEITEGEPDIIGRDPKTNQLIYADCSQESPKSRRSLCYDEKAWHSRKEHKPKASAESMAQSMGVEMMDEATYYQLQQVGTFDLKTSSWLKTPDDVRSKGGALFGDCRYGRVFTYHNGAESYYAARGFRAVVML